MSLLTSGQVAVQVPQLKQAETSAAPKRWRSVSRFVSTRVGHDGSFAIAS